MAPIHPLFGAGLRVDRAAEHLAELREQLQRWADLHSEQVGLALEGRTVKWKSELPVEELGRASMVIGDVLFNLRAALDYLVYVLAVGANKGRHVGGTQFPIEDDEDVFRGRVTGTHPATGKPVKQFLRKVTPVAAARIRQLQPFAGCVWTTELRELSNPDKHRA